MYYECFVFTVSHCIVMYNERYVMSAFATQKLLNIAHVQVVTFEGYKSVLSNFQLKFISRGRGSKSFFVPSQLLRLCSMKI